MHSICALFVRDPTSKSVGHSCGGIEKVAWYFVKNIDNLNRSCNERCPRENRKAERCLRGSQGRERYKNNEFTNIFSIDSWPNFPVGIEQPERCELANERGVSRGSYERSELETVRIIPRGNDQIKHSLHPSRKWTVKWTVTGWKASGFVTNRGVHPY